MDYLGPFDSSAKHSMDSFLVQFLKLIKLPYFKWPLDNLNNKEQAFAYLNKKKIEVGALEVSFASQWPDLTLSILKEVEPTVKIDHYTIHYIHGLYRVKIADQTFESMELSSLIDSLQILKQT